MMHQRHDEPVCLAAPSRQAPKPRSGAPKARGLTAKVRAKRSSALPWCRWFSSSCRSRKAFAKLNGKLAHGGRPFDSAPPAHAGILDREVQELQRRIVVGKAAAGLDDLAQRAMQRLDCVGRVDHLADAGGKGARMDLCAGVRETCTEREAIDAYRAARNRSALMPGRKKYAPPMSVVKAGRPVIFLRIGRLGMVKSKVPSWLPMRGSLSLPSS